MCYKHICDVLWNFWSFGAIIRNLDISIFEFIYLLGRDSEERKRYTTPTQCHIGTNLHQPKNLAQCFNWIRFIDVREISRRFKNIAFLVRILYRKLKWKFTISIPDVLNWRWYPVTWRSDFTCGVWSGSTPFAYVTKRDARLIWVKNLLMINAPYNEIGRVFIYTAAEPTYKICYLHGSRSQCKTGYIHGCRTHIWKWLFTRQPFSVQQWLYTRLPDPYLKNGYLHGSRFQSQTKTIYTAAGTNAKLAIYRAAVVHAKWLR